MLQTPAVSTRFSLLIIFFATFFVMTELVEEVNARSRGGGRSFGGSRSFSRQAPRKAPVQRNFARSTKPSTPRSGGFMSGGFMRSMAGGIAGGFLGSMLFSGLAHGGMGGGGGFGGSGIGLIEILLFGGIIYFLFKRFSRRRATVDPGYGGYSQPDFTSPNAASAAASADPVESALAEIQANDPEFDPDWFKEVAQDVFFKIQAGWMRRDLSTYDHLLGETLAGEYAGHFAEMKARGQLNKLENIAVRRVEIVDAGMESGYEFIIIEFVANLLDYMVDEKSGEVISGDSTEPVKFNEEWTFARKVGEKNWLLEAIKEKE